MVLELSGAILKTAVAARNEVASAQIVSSKRYTSRVSAGRCGAMGSHDHIQAISADIVTEELPATKILKCAPIGRPCPIV